MGFPASQATAPDGSAVLRDTKEISGRLELGTDTKSRLLTVNVQNSTVPAQREGSSWWAGASGAALFCGGRLIGVLVRARAGPHPADELKAVPVTALLDRPGVKGILRKHRLPTDAEKLTADVSYPAVGTDAHSGQAPVVCPVSADGGEGTFLAGRDEETDAVLTSLAPGDDRARPSVPVLLVTGMAGVGKSALASHAAATAVWRRWFPGGAVRVELRGHDVSAPAPIRPEQLYRPLLHAFGWQGVIDPTPGGQGAQYRQMLADLADQGRRVLLVLDDAANAEQMRALVPDGTYHRVLVTSRHALRMPRARRLRLKPLSKAGAVEMIQRELRFENANDNRVEGDPQEAARLAGLCGYLPLALHLAAGMLGPESGLTLPELVNELEQCSEELARLDHLKDEAGDAALQVALEVSHGRLETSDELLLFALFPVNPGPYLSLTAAAALTGMEPRRTREVLRKLALAHLIEPVGAGVWTQHDLIKEYAAGQPIPSAERRDAALGDLLEHYTETADAADEALLRADGTDRFPNQEAAREWLDTEFPNLIAAVGRAAETGHEWTATCLPSALNVYLHQRGHLDEWIRIAAIAVKTAVTTDYEDSEKAADRRSLTLETLGLALGCAERFGEAVPYLEEAIASCRPDHDIAELSAIWNHLSVALRRTGRYGEAVEAGRQALALAREAEATTAEINALNELGLSLMQLGDRYEEVPYLLDTSVALGREARDPASLADALSRRAVLHADNKEWAEAAAAYREAVGLSLELGEHNRVTELSTSLAAVLRLAGHQDEAVELIASLAQGLRDTEGTSLSARLAIGGLLAREGRHEEVLDALDEQLSGLDSAAHPLEAARLLIQIGLTQVRTLAVDEGEDAVRSAVALCVDAGEPEMAVTALTELSGALTRMTRYSAAARAAAEAVDLSLEKGVPEQTVTPLVALGVTLAQDGRFEEAVAAYEEATEALPPTRGTLPDRLMLALGLALRRVRLYEERTDADGLPVALVRQWEGQRDAGELWMCQALGLIHIDEPAEALNGLPLALAAFEATGATELADEARELMGRAERDLECKAGIGAPINRGEPDQTRTER
ncbi:tetratricopeptide repeat protein [Streptomyces sp. SudanB5_2050]|uniref:tetratricopeptide repeat protein n=1 Tax=Streptomyces sp. SudanB5_2050 TaxID=3035274 RepID=UPI0036DC920A